MSAAETASSTPLDDKPTLVVVSSPSEGEGGSEDGTGDSSKSSPGLSPTPWKPNADAAEWKPTFVAPAVAPSPAAEGENSSGLEAAVADKGEGGGDEASAEQDAAGEPSAGADADDVAVEPLSNGADTTGDVEGVSPGKEGDVNASENKEGGGEKAVTRYEIDFILKLRPNPEGTPKPAGLNLPDGVDILWDGKGPTLPKTGSMREGVRALHSLGGRLGSSRGLGEAKGAPPPLRGAQRDIGRDRDSRMDQRGGGRDDRRSGGGGGRDGRSGAGSGSRRFPIDTAPALEDCKPIEINEATRWKPKSLEKKDAAGEGASAVPELSTEEVLMKVNSILNKMTLERFNKLSVTLMSVGLRDVEVVTGLVDMIVDKAQMEHHFSSMYAEICERIARTPIAGLGEEKDTGKGSKKFKRILLLKVQDEFQKDWPGLFAAVQNDPNLGEEEKGEKEFLLKRKYMGHMRFVGELYKVELLKERNVHDAIQDMFGSNKEPDEERLECMTKLLQTCGKKLDQSASPETAKDMKRWFRRIAKLADTQQVSSRIRFMLSDLLELRTHGWVPRRAEEKAKTMQELHNDIAKEASKERASGRSAGGGMSRPGTGGGGSSSLRLGSGDARVASGSRAESSSTASRPASQLAPKPKDDDGWETVPTKGKGGPSADGWSQASTGRSRTSNPGSDERRHGGSRSQGGTLVAGQSAFALLSSQDEVAKAERKKKKKDSKDKKDKKEKSGKDKKKSKSGSKSSSSKPSTPPASETPKPAVEDVKAPKAAPPAAAAMTEDTARKKGKDGVAEFEASNELEEACLCFDEVDADLRWAAVSEAVSDAIERKQKHRDALGVVLLACAKQGVLTEGALMKGFNDFLEFLPDVRIDAPQAPEYVASAVAPLALGGYLPFGTLVSSPCQGLMKDGMAAVFASAAVAQVKAAAVAEGLSAEFADARVAELLGGALDLPKLAAMRPSECQGDEAEEAAERL